MRERTRLLASRCNVKSSHNVPTYLQTGLSQILDARSAARFSGEAAEPRVGLLSGHMPGALNLPYTQVCLQL